MRTKIGDLIGFFNDVIAELRKSAWPTRSELVESTVVVFFTMLILGLFVGASDQILVLVIRWLGRMAG
ncbi:MAG: preprotein translocase subunit SecE [Kiritimatiellae bacterium]|nr:preprotein translocase subunit SecE [Kiritimatiellia bacterium]